MVYCKECVRKCYCFDMRKDTCGLDCHKYKDRDYNISSRDGDCDSIGQGAFDRPMSSFYELNRQVKFGDIEFIVNF